MLKKPVYVYYIEIKNIKTRKLLTTDEIKEVLQKISTFKYNTRGEPTSLFRNLNGIYYTLYINNNESLRVKGSRVRDENLPWVSFSKERVERLKKPEGSEIMEISFGTFYLPEELTHGCFLFLLKNHHGMSITRLKEYIKDAFPEYTPVKTIIAKDSDVSHKFNMIKELRYVILDNKTVYPAKGEGVGDYKDRLKHPDEFKSKYKIWRMQIDVRTQDKSPLEFIKQLANDFGIKIRTGEDVHQFIADSNMRLVAVREGTRRQEEIDLTKNLYAFDYTYSGAFDESTFYKFCDEKFNNTKIRADLLSLSRGIVNIPNIDNRK